MRRHIVTVFFIGCILCFLILAPELQAPEITERDMLGYNAYHVAESGAILDRDGIIKGWFHANAIYDAQWNIKYHVHGNRLSEVDEDQAGYGQIMEGR
jgi:hypothetical protein